MKILDLSSKAMSMSGEVWMRHTNPWSVWTRILGYPLLILVFWSREWFGIYFLIPVVVYLLWTWLNPRLFPKPKSTNNWASKGVFGEKIFTERKKEKIKIPKHHITAAYVTITIAMIGFVILIYGLYVLDIYITLFGGSIAILGKMWFFDRMAWFFDDIKELYPKYKKWIY